MLATEMFSSIVALLLAPPLQLGLAVNALVLPGRAVLAVNAAVVLESFQVRL